MARLKNKHIQGGVIRVWGVWELEHCAQQKDLGTESVVRRGEDNYRRVALQIHGDLYTWGRNTPEWICFPVRPIPDFALWSPPSACRGTHPGCNFFFLWRQRCLGNQTKSVKSELLREGPMRKDPWSFQAEGVHWHLTTRVWGSHNNCQIHRVSSSPQKRSQREEKTGQKAQSQNTRGPWQELLMVSPHLLAPCQPTCHGLSREPFPAHRLALAPPLLQTPLMTLPCS